MSTYSSGVIIRRFDIAREEILKAYISGFALINQVFLRRFQVPRIYVSGIKYKDENPDSDNPLMNCLEVIDRRGGDCKSLTAWRLAELWEDGIDARCHVIDYGDGLCHVLIKHPNGFVEDISKNLGM